MPIVYLVVPCYNEEAVIDDTNKKLLKKMEEMQSENLIDSKSKIMYVDDGSRDKTWEKITKLCDENNMIEGVKLSHNKGHQNAVLAGLMTAMEFCDVAITLDADLQDDINVLPEFIKKYNEGCEVVYGVRKERKKDSFFKRTSAQGFYKVMNMLGAEVVYNHADYRLMSKRVLQTLAEHKEVNLFLRGIIPTIGFKSDCVYYERQERMAGQSKYPLKKMISFAMEGITSFSVKPLKIISSFGIAISFCSIIAMIYAFVAYFTHNTISGWTTIVASIWLLGGIQLLCLGMVGTYIGKIYNEVKQRPRFVVEEYKKHS